MGSICCLLLVGSTWLLMSQDNCNILNWNVRRLNDGARRDSVFDLVRDSVILEA